MRRLAPLHMHLSTYFICVEDRDERIYSLKRGEE